MRYQVRPLSFGEILDESFKVLKDHFVTLVGICAALYVPFTIVSALVVPATEPGVPKPPSLAALGPTLITTLIFLSLFPLTQLAVTRAVAAAYLDTPMTPGEAYRGSIKLYGGYAATLLVSGIAIFGASMLLVLPGIYFAVCWALVGPIFVIEGLRGRAAMRRSRSLMKGYWWRTAGVYVLIGLINGLVVAGVQTVLGAVPILGPALSGVVQSVSTAYAEITLVVLYVELRCRVEDFDLQRLANEVAASLPPPAAVPVPEI